MTPEQRQMAVERLIEELPEFAASDDLMISAVRHGVSAQEWIGATLEQRTEMKHEVYAHLKVVGNVKFLDDRLIREDLGFLNLALEHLRNACQEIDWTPESPFKARMNMELNNAKICIKQALEK